MLNGSLITERRLALGLSVPDLARALAVSAPVITRLERGETAMDLNLRQVEHLADLLGVPVASLFRTETDQVAPTPDDVKLEAAFALIEKKLSSAEIARGLAWPLDRTKAALESLRARVAPTGRRLQISGGRYALRPATGILSDEEVQRLERAVVSHATLSVATARALHDVLRARVDARWVARATENQRVALASLIRLGWVTQVDDRVVVTEDVALAFRDPGREQA
jgi:transcriptional regulator with XRE-family HTH domain